MCVAIGSGDSRSMHSGQRAKPLLQVGTRSNNVPFDVMRSFSVCSPVFVVVVVGFASFTPSDYSAARHGRMENKSTMERVEEVWRRWDECLNLSGWCGKKRHANHQPFSLVPSRVTFAQFEGQPAVPFWCHGVVPLLATASLEKSVDPQNLRHTK